jgi:hypothetical protein
MIYYLIDHIFFLAALKMSRYDLDSDPATLMDPDPLMLNKQAELFKIEIWFVSVLAFQ